MADFYPAGDDQARTRWTIIDALRRYGTDSGRIGHAFAELHQLQAADLRALVAIMSAEGNGTPLTAGQLREQLGLSSGGASLVIDRLERAGHIRRARDNPADNRVVHLRYTDQGRATGLAFFGSLGDRARAILDGFTGDELQVIARFITAMADSTRQHVQELEGRLQGCARPSRKKRPQGPTPGRAPPARPGSSAPRRRGACGGNFASGGLAAPYVSTSAAKQTRREWNGAGMRVFTRLAVAATHPGGSVVSCGDPSSAPSYRGAMTMISVRQLRVVVTADDFDQAVAFYRDVLGLTEQAAFQGDGDARVVILDAGHATLELANPAQAAMIDRVEVGQRVSPHIRLAFEVDDARAATDGLSSAGAEVIGGPAVTPWNSVNSRLRAPAGVQLTLFEELGG